MCQFCIDHGEGKKWYEVMRHYSRILYEEEGRRDYIKRFLDNLGEETKQLKTLRKIKEHLPFLYPIARFYGTTKMKRNHFGQVVPLEDAEEILRRVQSITRLPCVCRSVTKGRKDARFCFGLGIDPSGLLEDYPFLRRSLEVLSAEEAIGLLRDFERQGLVHTIWTFKTPFIGGLCNCDGDCLAYQAQISSSLLTVMFRAEYVAVIDYERCRGCRACQQVCQFGAIEYSLLERKSSINVYKCYGCGLCRNWCSEEAISLIRRQSCPQAVGLWEA